MNNILNAPKTTFAGLVAVIIPFMDWLGGMVGISENVETGIVMLLTALVTGTLLRTTDDCFDYREAYDVQKYYREHNSYPFQQGANHRPKKP